MVSRHYYWSLIFVILCYMWHRIELLGLKFHPLHLLIGPKGPIPFLIESIIMKYRSRSVNMGWKPSFHVLKSWKGADIFAVYSDIQSKNTVIYRWKIGGAGWNMQKKLGVQVEKGIYIENEEIWVKIHFVCTDIHSLYIVCSKLKIRPKALKFSAGPSPKAQTRLFPSLLIYFILFD